ncbi:DNA helicase [Xanthomonas phage BUDD]|nr:DNA helicase [Xanthomonas phage BUDD]
MQADIKLHYKNELHVTLDCPVGISYEVSEAFAFFVNGYKFMPAFKAGRWDGKVRLYNIKDRNFYIGLLPKLFEWAEENGYTIEYANPADFARQYPTINEESWNELKKCGKFEPKWYQKDAVFSAINQNKTLILSPTGSGKSYIQYLITRYLLAHTDGKILMTVPSTSLVEQMYSDFKDYVADDWDVEANVHRIYSGKEKYTEHRVVISTWQSAIKLPKAWFQAFGAYICDEAHGADAKSISQIIDQLGHAPFRLGLTGTLDGTKMHELDMQARFGSIIRVASTKDLQDGGDLAPLSIECLQLRYGKDDVALVKNMDYDGEIKFLVSHPKRNYLLAKTALAQKGNTLMLFNYVAKHGKVLYELLKPMCEANGKKLYFISGSTAVDDREQIRQILEKENNAILLASYGTLAVGVNVKNLHNLIFCHPIKAVIRTLQSIGRILRTAEGKQDVKLIDIADDLSYNTRSGVKKQNTILRHFLERLKIYVGEKWKYKIIPIKMGE